MNRKQHLVNAVLWATAIVAAAIVGAPAILSTTLLPALWAGSLVLAPKCPAA